MPTQQARVAIIGAGSSGMIAARELKERGIPFDCFEKGSQAGGNWLYKNDNGMSAAYRSLHINTSRRQMEFKCFPMPDHYPDFPHHSLIAEYFAAFLEHFSLKPLIRFNSEVKKAIPLPGGTWQLTLANGDRLTYDAVIVANGHHWDPIFPNPTFPGTFAGVQMHSHAYLNPTEPHNLVDKNVVIVGAGNSAMDIACDLSARGQAKKVFLAVRSGVHILPKYFGSRPVDSYYRHPGEDPRWWERFVSYRLLEKLFFRYLDYRIRIAVGKPEDFGLPRPNHSFGESHPTISSEIHLRLGSGDIIAKPNIQQLLDQKVMFTDGSVEQVDAIIYATGYKISFPFFCSENHKGEFLPVKDNDLALFKRMFTPKFPNLMFLGLVQPLCSIMPIAEQQAAFMAEYLLGQYRLPDPETMAKAMLAEHEASKRRYVNSKRHTIQINCLEYSYDLRQELKRGQKRSKSFAAVHNHSPNTFQWSVHGSSSI